MTIQQILLGGGRRVIELTISSTQTSQYNMRTAAGSPSDPVEVRLTVNADCQFGINQDTGWAAGSTCVIDNNASIYGTGGGGGGGGGAYILGGTSVLSCAGSGQAGGDALILRIPTTIDNAGGNIFGGGGGGGGGGSSADSNPFTSGTARAGGGGGGGGRGYNDALGGQGGETGEPSAGPGLYDGDPGLAGSSSAFGTGGVGGAGFGNFGGEGGDGGDWGQDGIAGDNASGPVLPSGCGFTGLGNAPGGAAGYAVRQNGNSVSFTAGNNASQVKGTVG